MLSHWYRAKSSFERSISIHKGVIFCVATKSSKQSDDSRASPTATQRKVITLRESIWLSMHLIHTYITRHADHNKHIAIIPYTRHDISYPQHERSNNSSSFSTYFTHGHAVSLRTSFLFNLRSNVNGCMRILPILGQIRCSSIQWASIGSLHVALNHSGLLRTGKRPATFLCTLRQNIFPDHCGDFHERGHPPWSQGH